MAYDNVAPPSCSVPYIDGINLMELYIKVVPRENVIDILTLINTLLPNLTIILAKIQSHFVFHTH